LRISSWEIVFWKSFKLNITFFVIWVDIYNQRLEYVVLFFIFLLKQVHKKLKLRMHVMAWHKLSVYNFIIQYNKWDTDYTHESVS
jgi:hypothetical protein